ncbi:MAG: Peptidase, family [Myxococcales bacterium]|nr:Peptidase, family [Myxococcales bacterium]
MQFRGPRTRTDLQYHDQIIEGEEVVVVHDPVRAAYYKFNLLQGAMLLALDGHKDAEQVAAELSAKFDTEIPPVAAERFIIRARELMLLDITSYSETPEQARKIVGKALRKAGFRMRSPMSSGGAPRPVTPESTLFAEALRQLDLGHPRAAGMYLAQILEHNPTNARARQLYDLVQRAYIRAAHRTTDYPIWVMFNPSNLLTWLSRTIGGLLFSWWGVLALLLYAVTGAYCYTLIDFSQTTAGPFDIALAVTFSLVIHPFVHEMAHGLACQHYGGNVTEIGYVLFFYFKPSAFCDTSSSYLISRRRHKVIVQLAGSVGSVVTLASTAILVSLLSPEVPIYSGFAFGLTVSSVFMFVTLVPFLKADGYFALADAVGFPNLRERAFKITKAWLAKHLFGLDLPTETLPPRTRKLLLLYGLTARAFTACFILFIFTRFVFTPLVVHFRGVGLLFAIGLSIYMWRGATFTPLWAGIRTLVTERRKIFTLRRSAALLALLAAIIAPLGLRWPLHVDAELVLRPHERAEVRAQTSGRIVEIFVAEGTRVRRGDPLARMASSGLRERIAKLEADREVADHRLSALRAGARDEELLLASRRAQRAAGERSRSAAEANLARRLAAAKLGTQERADGALGNAAQHAGEAAAAQSALALLEAGTREEDVKIAEAERALIDVELQHLRHEESLLMIRSPIDGVVATPRVADKLLARLKPGELFVDIHDLENVVAEIALSPGDPLSEIRVGDDVGLRLDAAPTHDVRVRVDRFHAMATPGADGSDHIVLVTSPFRVDRPVTGLTGHARVYGREHSLAYAHIYMPVRRLVSVTLWSMY